jgi:hypothetical protein
MTIKVKMLIVLLLSLLFLSGTDLRASAYEQEFVVRPEPILARGAGRLDLRFSIQHAKVTFTLSDDPGFIAKILVRYDNEALAPVLSENFQAGVFSAEFSSGTSNEQNMAAPLHDWEIQIGNYDLETDLTLDFEGVQANMGLGGMPLTKLVVNLKGAQAKLDFSEPTLLTMRNLIITCEGTFFQATGIGNTGFETFQLEAAGSSIDFNFNGSYAAGDYNADFKLNGSSARFTLPATAGALVVNRPANRPLELTGGGWSKEAPIPPEGYKTDDYEDLESRINLVLESTATSILIKREGMNLHYQLSY